MQTFTTNYIKPIDFMVSLPTKVEFFFCVGIKMWRHYFHLFVNKKDSERKLDHELF